MALACVATALGLAFTGCSRSHEMQPISETRLLLDTVCTVTVYDPAEEALLSEVLDLCAKYESLYGRTLEGSDVWRINHAAGAPVTVEASTAELIRAALDYGDFSGGLFDVTVGRLCALWDFTGNPAVPSLAGLAAARDTVDYRRVYIEGDSVRLGDTQAWLDLGGIAKGYIADQLTGFLKERGVKSAIVDLGGDIVTIGTKPDGSLWHIGVNKPFSDYSEIIGSLSVGEAAIVTSGIYERCFWDNGALYHHILDPDSGMPADSDVVSVTIVSESSMVGDALSTIVVLLGSEKAASVLDRAPGFIGAVIVLESGEQLQYGDIDFISAREQPQ